MPTFIKPTLWEKRTNPAQGYRGELNLDEFVNSRVVPGPEGPEGPEGPQGPPGDINSTGGNVDTLGGVAMRTLYSKNDPIEYKIEDVSVDLLKSSKDFFGSKEFPLEFFEDSVNYDSKTIHFRITGRWADEDATPDVSISILFGDDVLFTTNFTGAQANNHPAEIMGEIMFTKGDAYPCCSMGWCENNGTMRRWALSEPTARDVTAFQGGELKVVMNSTTTNSFTSYLAYVQVWN